MAYDYRVMSPDRVVVAVGRGPFVLEEFRDLLERIVAEDEYRPGFCLILDVRDEEGLPDPAQIPLIIQTFAAHRGSLGGRVAVIVSRPAQYGMARMVQAYSEPLGLEFRPFRSPEHAQAWLNGSGSPDPGSADVS